MRGRPYLRFLIGKTLGLLLGVGLLGLAGLSSGPARRLATATELKEEPPVETLRKRSEEVRVLVEGIASEPLPTDRLESAFAQVSRQIGASLLFADDFKRILLPRLKKIFDSMIRAKRFRVLNPAVRSELGLDSFLCRVPNDCKEIDGFYIPLIHLITVDPNLSDPDFSKALFHELVHAYQFTYRFPLDLRKLEELSDQNKYPREKLPEFLSAFYELQAHYYGMKFHLPPIWRGEMNSGTGKSLGWAVMNAFSAGKWDRHWRKVTNHLVPKVDRSSERGMSGILEFSALLTHELVPVGNTWMPSGFIDLRFQALLGNSITETYFGQGSRLLNWTPEENEIQVALHDHYYDTIGLSREVDEGSCEQLLDEALNSKVSPFFFWLDFDEEREISRCPTFRPSPTRALRDELARLVRDFKFGGSPFVFRGGEGTRPDIPIFPVQPNLRIKPVQPPHANRPLTGESGP